MKFPAFLARRLHWLNLPATLLVALLQRTPAVRVAAVAEQLFTASPIGTVLKMCATAVASLGAIQTLAGATQFVLSPNRNPITGTQGTAISPEAFTVTGAQTPPGSFKIVSGSLPPGITIPGLNSTTNVVNGSSATFTGTPTAAGSFSVLIRAYEFANATGDSWPATAGVQVNFTITGQAAVGPTITTQPASQTVNVGGTAVFTVAATGTPTPTYQWRKNGADITGATSASLTLPSVQLVDAGNYAVMVTNAGGIVPSATATLTVNAVAAPPVFTAQPLSQTVAAGSTVAFSAAATGATSYQWQRNGVAIAGATSATLVLTGAAVQPGTISVTATNASGSTPGSSATLAVVNTADPGRLINLSILTTLSAGEKMTMGTVLGGAGTSGTKALLARAAGPTLGAAPFNIVGVLPDPTMSLISTSASPNVTVAANNDWQGDPALSDAFARVGAFPYISATSKDAAIYRPSLSPGNYTVEVADAGAGTGTVIAELYDETPAASFAASTPRLINVSVLKAIGTGQTLTTGFYVGGSTAKTVLIRVIGPRLALAPFGIATAMVNPQVTLNDSSHVIASNDDWGGDPQLTAVANSVGAFAVTDPASKDSMLLITLPPGLYTAQAAAVTGTAGGTAIVEVYEVP